MSSRISVHTYDGYAYREVDFQRSTPLDLHILVDGAAATINSATCVARALGGTTTATLTVVNNATGLAISSGAPASETIKATFTTANKTTIGLGLYGEFELVWTLTILVDLVEVVRDWPEIVYLADQIPMPSVNLSKWVSRYAELGSSRSLDGRTNWWPVIQDAYCSVRNMISGFSPDRRIWMVRNHQAFGEITSHAAWMQVSQMQAQKVGGDGGDWSVRYRAHKTEFERLMGVTKASFAEGSHTPGTGSPQSDQKTLQSPSSLNGFTSNWNMGTGGFG